MKSRLHRTDFPQKVAFWKGNLLISDFSRLVNLYNLARKIPLKPSKNHGKMEVFFFSPENMGKQTPRHEGTVSSQWQVVVSNISFWNFHI